MMMNDNESAKTYSALSKQTLQYFAISIFALGVATSTGLATEPHVDPRSGNGGNVNTVEGRQFQSQDQFQTQFQDQGQTQRQGDNRVEVDGDDTDYFALALPNLVAASCAGNSYSVGGGASGFGIGFGAATVDENCQIAKAIATAHLLEGARLVKLTTVEYRRALCQMRGMEHVCNADYKEKKKRYATWCEMRVRRDTKATKWSDRDLGKCGIRRIYFVEDRQRWLQPTHYHGTKVVQHEVIKEEVYTQSCPHKKGKGDCAGKTKTETTYPKKEVVVRVGQHCDFDRVVFDWRKRVGYEVVQYGDEIRIDFDRESPLDVSSVRKDLGRYIIDARSEKREAGSSATLILASDVKGKVWRLGHRVIIDGRGTDCY